MTFSAQFFPDEGGAPIERPAVPARSFDEAVAICKGLARGLAASRFVLNDAGGGHAVLFTDAGSGWDEEDPTEG